MKFRLDVPEFDSIPAGFGIAYHDPLRRMAICFRSPLNHAVALWRRFWFFVRDAAGWTRQEARCLSCGRNWNQGHELGLKEGIAIGRKVGKEEAGRAINALFPKRPEPYDPATDPEVRRKADANIAALLSGASDSLAGKWARERDAEALAVFAKWDLKEQA